MTSMERSAVPDSWMAPLPREIPRRADLVFAQPRPVESIAIDVAESVSGFLYVAVSAEQYWSGVVAAPNSEVAVLDVIEQIRAQHPRGHRLRFVLTLRSRSPLWHYAAQIAAAPTDWWIERPSTAYGSLVSAAAAELDRIRTSLPPPLTDLGSVTVATDGSVRRKHAGLGWLASSGHYGLDGYRTSTRRDGPDMVLVAELRAIGGAVLGLPRRNLTVLSDSRAAVAMVDRWKRGQEVMPAGYVANESGAERTLNVVQRRIYAERGRIEMRWVHGHCGHPLNEGADALARLGSRFRRGDGDLDEQEYRRRAAGIAKSFAAEFRRINHVRTP